MTVGDILIKAGIMIGRPDIADFFVDQINIGDETYQDVALLLKIVNVVVNELSNTYFPLKTEQDVTFEDGIFAYENLEKKVVKILEVRDYLGNKVEFTEKTEYIELVKNQSPSLMLTVVYQFAPEMYYEESEIEYSEKDVPAIVIAYAVASEYCLSQSRFSEAVMHHNRYVLAIQELKGIKNGKIKGRSWL